MTLLGTLAASPNTRIETSTRIRPGHARSFAIARGLLTDPQVLFLDEPTRSLDPIAADELRQYISEHIVGELKPHRAAGDAHALRGGVHLQPGRHHPARPAGRHRLDGELRARTKLASVLDLVLDRIPPELPGEIQTVAASETRSRPAPVRRHERSGGFDGRDGVLDSDPADRARGRAGSRVDSCTHGPRRSRRSTVRCTPPPRRGRPPDMRPSASPCASSGPRSSATARRR